jgi:adenosylmethionine-8-amino-7-oxononanoate aminotransferase
LGTGRRAPTRASGRPSGAPSGDPGGWTCSAHPVSAPAGIANLEPVDRLGPVDNAREIGAFLLGALREVPADHPTLARSVRAVRRIFA